jgi:hypothetical protein
MAASPMSRPEAGTPSHSKHQGISNGLATCKEAKVVKKQGQSKGHHLLKPAGPMTTGLDNESFKTILSEVEYEDFEEIMTPEELRRMRESETESADPSPEYSSESDPSSEPVQHPGAFIPKTPKPTPAHTKPMKIKKKCVKKVPCVEPTAQRHNKQVPTKHQCKNINTMYRAHHHDYKRESHHEIVNATVNFLDNHPKGKLGLTKRRLCFLKMTTKLRCTSKQWTVLDRYEPVGHVHPTVLLLLVGFGLRQVQWTAEYGSWKEKHNGMQHHEEQTAVGW